MGFCTTINPRTGREVLVCDFCGDYPARKKRCPYGYCQAYAMCQGCRTAGKNPKSAHKDCEPMHREFEKRRQEREDNPKTVTVAAWGDWLTHEPGVCLVVTGAGDYYKVPTSHYHKRDVNGNNFIDANYTPVSTELANILLAAEYGASGEYATTKEAALA